MDYIEIFLFVVKAYNAQLNFFFVFPFCLLVATLDRDLGKERIFQFYFHAHIANYCSCRDKEITENIHFRGPLSHVSTPVVKKCCERDCTRSHARQHPSWRSVVNERLYPRARIPGDNSSDYVNLSFSVLTSSLVHYHLSGDTGRLFPEKDKIIHFPSLLRNCSVYIVPW